MRKYESTWFIVLIERENTPLQQAIDIHEIRIKARSKAAALEKLKDIMQDKCYSIEHIGR